MSYNSIITHPVTQALFSAVVILPLLTLLYFAFEPAVAVGQSTTEDFTVTQEIEGEIAFEVAPQDVLMDPAIPGLTGGTSNGSTTFAVSTNNPAGYNVTIQFAADDAMQYESGTGFIPNLTDTIQVNFEDGVGANEAAFGLTIDGANVTSEFLGDGSSCGSGSSDGETCWRLQDVATTPFTLVDSDDSTPSAGEAYDVYFRVLVNENPDPSLELGFYTATATLTATEK